MNRKIKLIWDFRGPNASEVAKHHEKHLKEYIHSEALALDITGCTNFSGMHSIAFMVVQEEDMTKVRDSLRPQRGELYDSES